MEKILIKMLEGFIKLVKGIFGVTLTETNALVIIFLTLVVIIVILGINLGVANKKRKTLKTRVLNNQIQVVTIAKGNTGKTKKIIRTKKDLANPKKNNKLNKVKTNKRDKNRTVVNIRED